MLTEHPKPSPYQIAQAEKLEQMAKDCLLREQESFDRCDTDGFLSQWANTISAREYRAQAQILRQGGYDSFPVLVETKTGKVVATNVHFFPHPKFSWQNVRKWRVFDENIAAIRRWIPYGSTSRVQKQMGLREEMRYFPAWAKVGVPDGQKSTGLSGCANAIVVRYRIDGPKYRENVNAA